MMSTQIHKSIFQLTKIPPLLSFFFSTSSRQKQQSNTSPIFELLVHEPQKSLEPAPRVESVLNCPENSNSLQSFLKYTGFSISQSAKIVKYRPRLQSASIENIIKPKIKIFQDLGFSADVIARLISTYPNILQSSANKRVIPSLSILKDVLGSDEGVAKVLRMSGSFLTKDLGKTLMPNVELLQGCGIQREQIIKVIYCYPRFLLRKPEFIQKCIAKADEMGANRSTKMFIYAVRVVSSMNDESLELRLKTFRDLGFSEYDISRMFVTAPVALAVSPKKLKKVKDVLLATGKYDMSCIVKAPISLCCSVENRYMPRIRVLEILESKKLIANWPTLSTLHTMSNERFIEKFVSPYMDEVGKVF